MSGTKQILSIVVAITFSLCGAASALTPKPGTLKTEKGAETTVQSKLQRVTAFMDRIEDNVLYLQNKKSYNLSGVKVVYGKAGSKKPALSAKKKIVEMIFVDDRLREVIVHP